MSVLTKPDILKALEDGTVVVDPAPEYIGPNSIDLRLHHELKTYRSPWQYLKGESYEDLALDARKDNETDTFIIPTTGRILSPGVLYLGRTIERTHTPHHVPKIGGRSSTGRLGIAIHITAGFGDVGFNGTWTLEISVVHPVRIYPGMRIAQLWLLSASHPLSEDQRYNGRYQHQEDATAYRGHLDTEADEEIKRTRAEDPER